MASDGPMTLLLDSGIVGQLCHSGRSTARPVANWFWEFVGTGRHDFCLPEIIDYELRRKLLHLASVGQASRRSIDHLDRLGQSLVYLPLDTTAMRHAAGLWADARKNGVSTAPATSLDIDVILAAQAIAVEGTVVTTNPRHLSRYVSTKTWEELANG
jgi:predicted nucleic acid-binding protein